MSAVQRPLVRRKIEDDRHSSLQRILEGSGKSLVELLIYIQKHASVRMRSFAWAATVTCLRAKDDDAKCVSGKKGTLQETKISVFEKTFKYAAVSYCNKPSKHEDATFGNYDVQDVQGNTIRSTTVRDDVLGRVIRFVQRRRLDGFWIDEECLDKDDATEKETAINGMDLVYRKSCMPIALLSTPLDTPQELLLLDTCLQGKFVEIFEHKGLVKLAPGLKTDQLRRVTNLLSRILSDGWWRRCWTFQEGYCSKNMDFSLPTRFCLGEETVSSKIGLLGSDVVFGARDFQNQVSLFCLAIQNAYRPKLHALWPKCRVLLCKARRYDVLFNYRNRTGKIRKIPMSAWIVGDVCRRSLKFKDNIPAIVANCCNYTTRIEIPNSVLDRFSLSLVVLTLFLVNGEMLTYRSPAQSYLSMTVSNFLERQSFHQPILPVATTQLTHLKRRRWPRVQLYLDGIRTWGQIWRVDLSILLRREPQRIYFDRGGSHQTLKPFERARLRQLVSSLKGTMPHLSYDILHYLDKSTNDNGAYSQHAKMMRIMAKRLCRAMKKGHRLLFGAPADSELYRAVFVCNGPEFCEPIWTITSWEEGQLINRASNLRAVEKHMSFEVMRNGSAENGDQLWQPQRWIDGMSFCDLGSQTNVLGLSRQQSGAQMLNSIRSDFQAEFCHLLIAESAKSY